MQYIRQQEKNGCAIASLAMVTGKGYWEVRDFFGSRPNEEEGVHTWEVESYLAEHGYAVAPKDRMVRSTKRRQVWPPQRFAPVHLVVVKVFENSPLTHMIVMDANGAIYDPENPDDTLRLSDYHDVLYMAGVYPIEALCAA